MKSYPESLECAWCFLKADLDAVVSAFMASV